MSEFLLKMANDSNRDIVAVKEGFCADTINSAIGLYCIYYNLNQHNYDICFNIFSDIFASLFFIYSISLRHTFLILKLILYNFIFI